MPRILQRARNWLALGTDASFSQALIAACNRQIVALLDDERVMVLENRRGSSKDARAGEVRVSVQKTKSKKMVPVKQAANY